MLEKKSQPYKVDATANILHPNDCNFEDNKKSLRADAKQNRELILKAAHQVFAEKGLSVPIGEIARQAGVGIGTVYRHFPTKEALFEAVNISYKQQLTEEAKSIIHNADPGKAFFDFFTRIIEEGFANRAVEDSFKIWAFNTGTANSGVLHDFQSAFSNLLTRAQQAKKVRRDIEVRDLITLMSGLLLAVEQRKDASDSSRFNRLLSVVRDGLRYKE